ncbi:MAG: ATP-binding protein [Deltaproteobacteria bacterium]|nr:ATP-binding protein [Deltaproteobacteria bacterium]
MKRWRALWPGRFEWKVLGAMAFVGALSVVTAGYAMQFSLRGFSELANLHQQETGEAAAQAEEVFRAYFVDRKEEFRRRTEELANMRPQRMGQLAATEGLMRARLLRGNAVLDEWQAPPSALGSMRESPPILAAVPLSYGEEMPQKILELTFGINGTMYTNFLELREAMDRETQMHRAFEAAAPKVLKEYFSFVLAVLIVPPLLGLWLARRTTKRVARLRDAARRVGAGDLSVKVAPQGKDELDELGRAFDSMVSELIEARSRLEYMQKVAAWQEVARRLAHEIKNPLTPIQLAVQQLVSKYTGDDTSYRRLLGTADEILREEITSLRRLVDDFSAFAKLSRAEPVPVDVTALVQDFARQHPEWERFITVDVPNKNVLALVDKVLFRRVLSNLVENAVQAAEGAKRVPQVRLRVEAAGGGSRVSVVVEDNGPGVPPSERQRIFDPYITHKEGGTGLGLAIVRKILIDHGGDITVGDAGAVLGGARFDVRVPKAD